MTRTVMVTGVAGFLGSHLADELIAAGNSVVGIDDLSGGDIRNVPSNVRFLQIDCADRDAVFEAFSFHRPEIVYHCAALAHEGLSVFSPATIGKSVHLGSVSVFSAAIANGAKRIIFTSSMARYGAQKAPFHEGMTPAPVDPYGIAKVAAENTLMALCNEHGVEWVIAVPHNIIGPRQKFDDPYRNVASIMLNRIKQGLPVIVYGDGSQTRCFSPIGLACIA